MTLPGNSEFEPKLDHVVINVKEQLDAAQKNYEALGFQITKRGHHTLGSSNHLAIFNHTYLELLGFEAGKGFTRPELLNAPAGLTGLVFKTSDAIVLHKHLTELGFTVEEPKSFQRPVTLENGETHQASFRTIHIPSELTPNGRTFYCDQRTPDLVWRDAWRQHPNQVQEIIAYIFASKNPEASVAVYSKLFPQTNIQQTETGEYWFQAGAAKIRFLPVKEAQKEFKDILFEDNDTERRVALTLQTNSLAAVQRALQHGAIQPIEISDTEIIVGAQDAFGIALKFVEGK